MSRPRNPAPRGGAGALIPARENEAEALPDRLKEVASTGTVSPNDLAALMEEVKDLRARLELSEQQRTDAEKAALAAAEAQGMLIQSDIQEVATGRTVKVKRAVDEKGRPAYKVVGYKDDGREILKPVFRAVELPTFYYKVDMPACGGLDAKLNGDSLYHGVVYEFDIDTLRTVKEIIYRLRDHERNTQGSNENFYRKPQEKVLNGGGRRIG